MYKLKYMFKFAINLPFFNSNVLNIFILCDFDFDFISLRSQKRIVQGVVTYVSKHPALLYTKMMIVIIVYEGIWMRSYRC